MADRGGRKKGPGAAGDGYVPLAVRFKAWWEGVDVCALMTDGVGAANRGDDPNTIVVDPPDPAETGRWPESRLRFCQRLWGADADDEVVRPGGSLYSFELAKPMGLDSSKSAIDLGAGLGGGTRKLAGTLDLWISGYELDPELAEHAMHLSRKHGMEKRAPVLPIDEDSFDLPARKADGILMRERLFRFRNKQKILDTAFNAMKPRGHLIVTDFVLRDDKAAGDPLLARWQQLDRERAGGEEVPALWTKADLKKALLEKRLDLRIYEDETEKYAGMIRCGWSRFVEGLDKTDMTRKFVDTMMGEAEYWLIFEKLLNAGVLCYVRAHGIRGGETL